MTKTTRTMIAAAAVAGILTGMTGITANAGVLSSSVMADEKHECPAKKEKEKETEKGKDKESSAGKDKKDKMACGGKDSCPGKKEK